MVGSVGAWTLAVGLAGLVVGKHLRCFLDWRRPASQPGRRWRRERAHMTLALEAGDVVGVLAGVSRACLRSRRR